MQATQLNPDAFRSVFCMTDQEITAETIQTLFTPKTSPLGSNKCMVESLVLSRWHDYLQDIEDGDEKGISLRDILFFTTGCKSIPPRSVNPSIEFLDMMTRQGFLRQTHVQLSSNYLLATRIMTPLRKICHLES